MDAVRGVGGTSVGEGWSDDRHRVVSTLHNEHPHQLLDTVDDEVAAKLVALLSQGNQLARRQAIEVAPVGGDHDRQLAGVSDLGDFLFRAVVDGPRKLQQ